EASRGLNPNKTRRNYSSFLAMYFQDESFEIDSPASLVFHFVLFFRREVISFSFGQKILTVAFVLLQPNSRKFFRSTLLLILNLGIVLLIEFPVDLIMEEFHFLSREDYS